jgi:hypothetical protein
MTLEDGSTFKDVVKLNAPLDEAAAPLERH